MELKSAIVEKVLPMRQGSNDKGTWRTVDIIVRDSLPVRYPDRFMISFWNEEVDKLTGIGENCEVQISWSANVREYERENKQTGEWYTARRNENRIVDIKFVKL